MADPINLNRARKAKARMADQARVAENRVKFGRTKAERLAAKAEAERLKHALDQTRRDK
jgi:hypothetical protein